MAGPSTDAPRAAPPGSPPFKGMVWVPGGMFLMGSNDHYREEAPAHSATVSGFWIDRAPVTGAERVPDLALYPGAKTELLYQPQSCFICVLNYYRRHQLAARMAQPIDTSTCHLGFRGIVHVEG